MYVEGSPHTTEKRLKHEGKEMRNRNVIGLTPRGEVVEIVPCVESGLEDLGISTPVTVAVGDRLCRYAFSLVGRTGESAATRVAQTCIEHGECMLDFWDDIAGDSLASLRGARN